MRTTLAALCCLPLAACVSGSRVHVEAENALGPYSASVEARGLVFVSGKGGASGGSFADESEAAIRALEHELARTHLTLASVVSVTVFLTDMALYGEFNQVYARLFPKPYPARACVAVAALPANFRVEIQAIASRP
jgi:2-iminobutanoate/2-iminopropanoate deaminase